MHRIMLLVYMLSLPAGEAVFSNRLHSASQATYLTQSEIPVAPVNWAVVTPNQGMGQSPNKPESLRAYGHPFVLALLGTIIVLMFFRGREMRRQHPRAFH